MNIEILTKNDILQLLNAVEELKEKVSPTSPYCSKQEALKLLDCSDSTLAKLRMDRKISYVKAGGNFLYLRESLFDFLNSKVIWAVS